MTQVRHCEERSDVAIQFAHLFILDRHASLAMTDDDVAGFVPVHVGAEAADLPLS